MAESATVGDLLRQRLKELKRTSKDLAEALEVPPSYIDDLISGRRRAPLPGRTDLYERMTSFLRLGRNDLINKARAERAGSATEGVVPSAEVRKLLLELCEPATAKQLERRRSRSGWAELSSLLERVVGVTQGAVRRTLDDQIGLRLNASHSGRSYEDMRLRVLEFLDATPDTVTLDHLAEFVQPRIARWDVDLPTGVLRVVMRAQEPRERTRRAPAGARGPRHAASDE